MLSEYFLILTQENIYMTKHANIGFDENWHVFEIYLFINFLGQVGGGMMETNKQYLQLMYFLYFQNCIIVTQTPKKKNK